MDLILCGNIGRGLRLIDSNGVSPQEDPQVREQMREKHPSPKEPVEWPELPEFWIQIARDKMDLRKQLERVLNDADPNPGLKRVLDLGAYTFTTSKFWPKVTSAILMPKTPSTFLRHSGSCA